MENKQMVEKNDAQKENKIDKAASQAVDLN